MFENKSEKRQHFACLTSYMLAYTWLTLCRATIKAEKRRAGGYTAADSNTD